MYLHSLSRFTGGVCLRVLTKRSFSCPQEKVPGGSQFVSIFLRLLSDFTTNKKFVHNWYKHSFLPCMHSHLPHPAPSIAY